MSDSSIFVSFGADTKGLEASIASARSLLRSYVSDLAEAAREQAKAGASAESELGQKLLAAAEKVAKAREELRGFQEQLKEIGAGAGGGKGVADSIKEVNEAASAGAHGKGTGLGFYVRELHALGDEFASGRYRQFEGSLTNLILTFAQSNMALAPYIASVVALGAALYKTASYAYEMNAAVANIRLDAAANGFQLTVAQAEQYRDVIKQIAGVSAEDSEKILKPFAALGQVGGTIAEMLAPTMKQLAATMGGDVGKAAETVAERFVRLDTTGLQFVAASRGMTQAQKDHVAELINSGQRSEAYAALVDLTSRSLRALKDDTALASAAQRDHMQALQLAASAGYSLEDAERMVGLATQDAKAKIEAETGALNAQRIALLAASSAAETFASAMATALKVDTIGAGLKETGDEIRRIEAGLAVAPDHMSAATNELGRALDLARDKMKALRQQQADPGGLGRDLLQQDTDALTNFDNRFRGSEQARLAGHLAMLREMLASDELNAQQRFKLQADLESSEKQLYDSQAKSGAKAAKDALGAAEASVEGQIRALEAHTRALIEHLGAEVKLKQISESAKADAAIKALTEESKAVDALYAKELALAGIPATKRQEIENRKQGFDDSNALQQQEAQEKAAEATQKAWDSAFKQINGAFDSEINGLLRGTESWGQALKNVLATLTEDLIKFFVNWGLQSVEQFAKDAVLNQTRVASHVAGNASIAASDASASAAGGLAWAANAVKTIEADAAQVFGGVFAWLAPAMGPAAAGPAAGASAAVLAGVGAVASADIGAWTVPQDMLTLVHKNELVATPGQADAIRSLPDILGELSSGGNQGGAGGVSVNPSLHVSVAAMDGQSVERSLRSNSGGVMRALNQMVRDGAHLGNRRLSI